MNVKLYHGEDEITVHPSKVDEMKSYGWSEKKPPKNKKATPTKPA